MELLGIVYKNMIAWNCHFTIHLMLLQTGIDNAIELTGGMLLAYCMEI